MKKSNFYLKTLILLTVVVFGFIACNKDDEFHNKLNSSEIETKTKDLSSLREFFKGPLLSEKEVSAMLEQSRTKKEALKTHYTKDQLHFMYLGLSIKGSGGGGAYMDGLTVLNKISNNGIDVYDVSSADDSKIYIVAGGIGSPTSVAKNIDGILNAITSSVGTLANVKDKQIGGVLSVESGSLNSLIAMLISQKLNVPLINADGAGRSVPTLSNLSYAHEDYGIAPMVLTAPANPESQISVSHPADADDAENKIRNIISQPGYGNIGGLALWAQTGKELKNSKIVKNTFSNAYSLGLATYKTISTDKTSALDNYLKNESKFISSYTGILSDFTEQTVKGLDVITLEVKINEEKSLKIQAINENLFLKVSDGTIVTAPHLMSYLIKDNKGNYVPFNNGDTVKMKTLIGNEIYVVCSYAEPRLYDIRDTFLKIIKSTPFHYQGGVVPFE